MSAQPRGSSGLAQCRPLSVENCPIGSDMQSKRPTLSAIKFDPQLWRHPERWPHDPLNYVFLARAFGEIGRARYGDEWTDRYIEPEEPPDDCDEAADEQYDRDCEEAELKFENMHASIARAIAEQSELGNLVTALRHRAGGRMNALDPDFWNTEYFGPRFFRCQMSLDQPFEDPARVSVGSCYWIYVTRASLDRYIRGGSPAVPAVNPPEMGQSKPKGRSGRRPGTGSWDVADKPLLEEMHRLITDGLAKSPNDAARQLADKAKGNSIPGSKQTRLAKGYRRKYISS
jgi:hypothetical protein